jgi:hypothetical protein
MKTLATALLTLSLAAGLSAQTAQTGTKQPDAKAKPADKPPAGAKTGDSTAANARAADAKSSQAFEMPKPAPEIERLLQMFQGRWTTEEKHEPSEMMPQGGTGKGQESVRPGPGKMSLIAEYTSQGPMGEFSGIGIITWDPAERAYKLHWTDNMTPTVTVMTGKWEGKDLVFSSSGMMMGKKMYSRHTFSDLTPTTFTYTIDEGPQVSQLKRMMTIKYTKVDMNEMRNRRLRGLQ